MRTGQGAGKFIFTKKRLPYKKFFYQLFFYIHELTEFFDGDEIIFFLVVVYSYFLKNGAAGTGTTAGNIFHVFCINDNTIGYVIHGAGFWYNKNGSFIFNVKAGKKNSGYILPYSIYRAWFYKGGKYYYHVVETGF